MLDINIINDIQGDSKRLIRVSFGVVEMQRKEKFVDVTKINKDFVYLGQFVKYPYDYLKEFAKEIDDNKRRMSIENIERVIHLLEVDTFCLKMGLMNNIHPITGYTITSEYRVKETENLIRRNKMWIMDLRDAINNDNYDV